MVDDEMRRRIGLLIVATESGLDYGKPLSTYVHKWLGIGEHCRNFELKHACYGGTAALQMAAAWLRSGVNPGAKVLVITTDIARRHMDDPAELTAGSGAMAMIVSTAPRIFELETVAGCATREVYDVARPTATAEYGDAVLSLYAYLDLLEIAYDDYRKQVKPVSVRDHFEHMVFHAPLLSLVERAHRMVLESEDEGLDASDVAASFAQLVQPTLVFNRETGNLYSGSVFASLAGLFATRADVAPGRRVGVFSYGSGSCAEFYSGLVGPAAHATVAAHQIDLHLSARHRLDVATYESTIEELEKALTASEYRPLPGPLAEHFDRAYRDRGLLVVDTVQKYHRTYRWS